MYMKRLFFLSMAALTVLAAFSCKKHSNKAVDYSQRMDDPIFQSYCLENFDTDGDGKIPSAEAKAVEVSSVPDMGIRSLKGIEGFVNLQRLDCSRNELTSLDLRKNGKLVYLDCQDNDGLDVIYLKKGQEIEEILKTPHLNSLGYELSVNWVQYYTGEFYKPYHFELNLSDKVASDSVLWESDAPQFKKVKTAVQNNKATLDFTKGTDIGDLESGRMYKMWASTSNGLKTYPVRFCHLGRDPLVCFEYPQQHLEAVPDQRIVFSVFFYAGEGESGTPSIKTQGEGCNRSFINGVKIQEVESIHWDRVGEKKVILYFEMNGKRTRDTLYVNIVPGLPEIKYLD